MNKIKLFMNIYVHYPEVYNSSVINNKLENYINDYFKINKPKNSEFDFSYLTIKSAPSNEEQMMVIDIMFLDGIDESINKDRLIKEWKEYFYNYFNNEIKDIIIKF